jgi:hypothetical protein
MAYETVDVAAATRLAVGSAFSSVAAIPLFLFCRYAAFGFGALLCATAGAGLALIWCPAFVYMGLRLRFRKCWLSSVVGTLPAIFRSIGVYRGFARLLREGEPPCKTKNFTSRFWGFCRPGPWQMCSLMTKPKRSGSAWKIHAVPGSNARNATASGRSMTTPLSGAGGIWIPIISKFC